MDNNIMEDDARESESTPELAPEVEEIDVKNITNGITGSSSPSSISIKVEQPMVVDTPDSANDVKTDREGGGECEEISIVKPKEETPPPYVNIASVPKPVSESFLGTKVSPPADHRGSSPEKKVVTLSPVPISNVLKIPTKPSSAEKSSDKASSSQLQTDSKSDSGQRQQFLKLSQALANAIKSDPKKKVFCANTNCNVKTENVVDAPSFARLYYYGLSSSKSSSPKICTNCYKKAVSYDQKSTSLVRNKENLFSLSIELQTAPSDSVVDLDSPNSSPHDSDNDVSEENVPESELYSIPMNEFNDILQKAMQKFDIKTQVENCKATVANELDNLSYQFSNLDLKLDELRDEIDGTQRIYNDSIASQTKVVEIGSVQFEANGGVYVHKAENLSEIEGLGRISMRALNKAVEDLKAIAENRTLQTPTFQPQNPAVVGNRRLAKLIFVKPKENQDVFAMHKHCLFYWLPAKILRISTNTNSTTIYTVQFTQRIKPRSRMSDDSDAYIKELTGKQLAFKKPTSITLPVGTRIIAKFKDLLKTDVEVDGKLYAGIIAEIPKTLNKLRYLIFFDDGYAQYCNPSEVLPVVDSSSDVWLDVHKNSQEFIKEYVTKFPDRHMLRAEVGATFNVELNGNWIHARVADVDASLLKVQYLRKAEVGHEWVYRGSTRLGPLFNRIKLLEAKPVVNTVARRHTYRSTHFSIEVNRDNADDEQNKVARKHTGHDQGQSKASGNQGQVIRTKNGMIISTVLESEGNMIKIQIPMDRPVPKIFMPHVCSPSCAHTYIADECRKISPLAIPFYLGWARELSGVNRDKVYYHSPCGVRCGSYKEVHAYITKTKIEIPIDYFSMEANIDCLNEFEPVRRIEYLKDISYGKEWTPISCVNSLDHELPSYMEYLSARIPGEGVKLNTDDGFLVCCDCEDDCEDKEKCACWQQTMSGLSFKIAEQDGETLVGFENRRLKQHILSGIYECNRKCKCRSTCFNRVVQHKVKWPIQMFKTVAKGWGVRALHDMPQGSFICVYTGKLLTDAGANETGKEVGDEYLAELDFIECNEQMKDDYESDVTEIEAEEPGTRSNVRLARQNSDENKDFENRKKQEKKATVQKAFKSTGGKRRNDDDAVSTCSSISTISAHSVSSNQVARKSGSRNGSLPKNKETGSDGKNFTTSSSGIPSPASTIIVGSEKETSDSDDDDVQAYSSFTAKPSLKGKKAPRLPLREYFGRDEAVYIMDAKSMGNFGRYLNHSCNPNVFVQNLFVDTHDPRFPWVAFFTKKDVKAGTELTWDYNYEIGSVPGKTLYCYCLQQGCRGRLL